MCLSNNIVNNVIWPHAIIYFLIELMILARYQLFLNDNIEFIKA